MSKKQVQMATGADHLTGQEKTFDEVRIMKSHKFDDYRSGVYTVRYSDDASVVAVGYGDGSIDLIQGESGEVHKVVKPHKHGGLPVLCTRFHPKQSHTFFSSTATGIIYQSNTLDGSNTEAILEHNNEINCLDFTGDGDYFATGGKDLDIRIYDSSTFQLVKTYEGNKVTNIASSPGHAHRIFALRYLPDSNYVMVTGGWDNHLKIWDTRTLEGVKRTIHGPHICGDSIDIKDKQILTGSWTTSDALQIWDFSSGDLIKTVPFDKGAEGEFLYSAKFCDSNILLAGGSGTNSLKAIHAHTDKVIGEVPLGKAVQALDTYDGGSKFVVGGGSAVLHLCSLVDNSPIRDNLKTV